MLHQQIISQAGERERERKTEREREVGRLITKQREQQPVAPCYSLIRHAHVALLTSYWSPANCAAPSDTSGDRVLKATSRRHPWQARERPPPRRLAPTPPPARSARYNGQATQERHGQQRRLQHRRRRAREAEASAEGRAARAPPLPAQLGVPRRHEAPVDGAVRGAPVGQGHLEPRVAGQEEEEEGEASLPRGVRRRGSGGARARPGGVEVLGPRHRPQLPGTPSFIFFRNSALFFYHPLQLELNRVVSEAFSFLRESLQLCSYDEDLKDMEGQSREEYVGSVRRKSSGFARGVSKYRGVARHHHNGRWEARIGRVLGNKYLYLGTYATQEEAAVAYDIAAIEHRGLNAVTNFDISHYIDWHRRRRRGLDATEMIPVQLPNDLTTEHARATIGLDETVAVAAFHDGEHHRHPYHVADSYIAQLPDDQVRTPIAPTSSALDLLLRSPKFMEMMEQASTETTTTTTTTTATESNASSPSPCTSPSSPSLSQPSPERQPELSGGASSAPPCCFPDDVQTHFECDDDGMSFAFAEVDTFLFGDLGLYAAPMFQCDVDAFV